MTTATKLQINWTNNGCDCGNCDFTVETVKGSDNQLFDGDKVVCNKCGKIGEIEALGVDGCDVIWSDKYQTKATKCIAVKTPFGNMYLTKDDDYDTYHHCDDDKKTKYVVEELCTHGLHITPAHDGWVAVYNSKTLELVSYLPIVSNYGDQFPQ